MAETTRKTSTTRKQSTVKNVDETIDTVLVDSHKQEELNLETKVTVKSIADWVVGFARRIDGYGDITISPKGSVRLSRNEIIAQVQNGNKLFCGVDGHGSHATLIIDDIPTRIEVDFESADGEKKQKIFSDELVKELFDLRQDDLFYVQLKESIHTRAEKYAIIDAIKRMKINNYSRIRFVEDYTGYKVS